MAATLKLTRGFGLTRQPFEITLDGAAVGTVPRHESVELSIDAGHHTLRLGSGRRISPERAFDASDGETISFACHGAAIWPIYLASLVKPDLSIALKRE